MKVLIVSSAPRAKCGIARYASGQAAVLRKEGHTVDWLSTDGGTEEVRYPCDLRHNRLDYLKLLRVARGYDKVIVHHQHDLFHARLDANEIAFKNLVWTSLFRTHRGVEVVAHELLYSLLAKGEIGRKIWMTEHLKWKTAPKIIFHTTKERDRFLKLCPEAEKNVELKEHHAEMVKYRDCSQAEARLELGLEAGAKIFLCIGFIQDSKGFDRAVQAFADVESPDARLYIVGSCRVEDPAQDRYLQKLKRLAAKDSRVRLVEGFIDDVQFDTWVIASDVMVLPYRNIWSSGVAARAHLFGRPMIAADVGGLGGQLKQGDALFETELELSQALDAMAGGRTLPERKPRTAAGPLKLAFVVPWYGRDIPGGAEAQARKTLLKLVQAGAQVEVLTTRIQDYFSDWSVNARPAGVEVTDNILVRRFGVLPRDAKAFNAINEKVCRRKPVTDAELQIFEREMIKCPELIRYISEHQGDYDLFVFIPYMFATTLWGSRACPGKAVHIPCLHDEGYMDLDCYADMLLAARGILFNAPAERELAIRKVGVRPEQYAMAGEGVETDWSGDGQAFREKHGLGDYLLFIGRKDADKNFPLLIENFRRYRDERAPDLTLVVMGPGGLQNDSQDGDSIRDLGFASLEDKRDALAGSLALCQPSLLESFSLTVMESWIASRPVLVHADCDVTRDHCTTSGGGLYFRTYAEFAACLDRLRADRALGDEMGRAGRAYVHQNYAWPLIVDRYLRELRRWADAPKVELKRAS